MSKKQTYMQKFRRGIATLLASVMTVSSLSTAGAMTSYAATELTPLAMDNNHGGTTTAYSFKSSTNFGFSGIKDGLLVGSDNPYQENDSQSVKTTYGWGGYSTAIREGGTSSTGTGISLGSTGVGYNGGVYSNTSMGVEIQMKLYPSTDEKWIIAEYIFYNTKPTANSVELASFADVQVGAGGAHSIADHAKIIVTSKGLHQVNPQTLEVFDLVTQDPSIGIDNSGTDIKRWMGALGSLSSNRFNDNTPIGAECAGLGSGVDTAISYSWLVNLQPYEIQTRKVAFGVKSTSYYVSTTGNNGNDGNYYDPLRTIEEAVTRLSGQKGYIYMMDDYDPITSTIDVGSLAGTDITILSTDLDFSGNAVDDIHTLTRSSSLVGPMFKTTGATLRISDLTLDGNNLSSPDAIIEASGNGMVGIQPNATLQNNIITDPNKGSAIDLTGSANLDMNSGKITGNQSAGSGAVNFNSNGYYRVRNEVTVNGNTASGKPANVYLPNDKTMTINGELSGVIGVTTETEPTAEDPSAAIQLPATRVKVVDSANSGSIDDPTYYTDVFKADVDASTGVHVSSDGTNVVLKRTGLSLTRIFIDDQSGEVQTEQNLYYGVGEALALPVDVIANYEYVSAVVNQGTYNTVTLNAAGDVGGTMPNTPVVITYTYRKESSGITFHANYGTPQPANLSGAVGTSVGASLPVIGKYGYTFEGWYSTDDFQAGTDVTALPSTFPATPMELHAKWSVKTSITFDYLVKYTNASESLVFHTSTPAQYYATHPLAAQAVVVPGYIVDSGYVSPDEYEGDPVGSFDGVLDFTGAMPNQDTQVTYNYRVDYGTGFNYTVRHETVNGTVLSSNSVTKYAEDSITASPESIFGYELDSVEITQGDVADPANYIVALSGSPAADGSFSSQMPNQDVTIVYKYHSNGSGYDFVVEHLYNSEEIRDTSRTQHPADDSISVTFENVYGYLFQSHSVTPAGHGNFDSSHNYTALMPNDDVHVTYNYNRDPSKWKTITYKSGANGSLNNTDRHAELVAAGSNYQAPLLISDGSVDGDNNSYSWEKLGEKKLVPNVVPDYAYKLGGWYEDSNNDGVKNAGEEYVTDSEIFYGNITLTADFIEDPNYWIDINFASGSRGNLTSGPATMHLKLGTTWGAIAGSVPSYSAQVNYLPNGWHVDGTPVNAATVLADGKTYIIQFKPDPNIFGTDLQAPDANGSVDVDGSGMITVYGTAGGYQYVITDMDGKIVAVQDGSDLSSSLIFHDLYPGSRYNVYEVNGGATVNVGSDIDSIASGDRSTATEVLIPVVENNVSVLYDEEEDGKVKIVVDPADPDAKYALVDKDGNVVHTDGSDSNGWVTPSGSNPKIEWGGLDANEDYTIVAIPKDQGGVDPVTKLPDGSVVNTDPSGELDIPYFIIETIEGTILTSGAVDVGSDRYDQAVAGETVTIYADDTNSAGYDFLYWKVVVGGGFAGKITDQQVTFTMPATNVVLCAYYERPVATPSNAEVKEEVRGGSENEMALDPSELENLENTLTTDEDRDLMDVNGATVTYKVVFDKNNAKNSDLALVKDESLVDDDHPDAFTGAWGLDIYIERYVNGRKAGVATPSDATFDAIVQLDKDDVDMMDYELYQLVDDGSGNLVAQLVAISDDPEETGGLFRFTAEANSRYILIYSKSYKVTVLNEVVPPAYYYRFKIRKGEAISDTAYYSDHYDELMDRDAEWSSDYDWIDAEGKYHTWTDNDGVWHDYKGFSTKAKPSSFKEYDLDRVIKKPTVIYAYYDNNKQQVVDERKALEDAIKDAIDLSNSYYLTIAETEELKTLIAQAQDVLNQTDRKANYDELRDALKELLRQKQPYEDVEDDRKDDYDDKHSSSGSGSKGGGGGGGGTGSGTKANPYIPTKGNTYTVGVNGSWELVGENQWAFTLNGGTRLRSMWAWLVYNENGVDKTGWYHFNREGLMNDGWFRDEAMNWYYCDTVHDGGFGRMKTGWHYDTTDGRWYYLDPASGMMVTGWKEIGGVWYYFTTSNTAATYTYDAAEERWHYTNANARPLGSMYKSEMTPDGYQVNDQGGWIR